MKTIFKTSVLFVVLGTLTIYSKSIQYELVEVYNQYINTLAQGHISPLGF